MAFFTIDEAFEEFEDFDIYIHKSGDSPVIKIHRYRGSSEDVIIPASFGGVLGDIPVTSIDILAFSEKKHITNVNLPVSLVSIGLSAFRDCTQLTNITLPKKLINFGECNFIGCRKLEEIVVDKDNPAIILSEGIKYIGDKAFIGCKALTSIILPRSLRYI